MFMFRMETLLPMGEQRPCSIVVFHFHDQFIESSLPIPPPKPKAKSLARGTTGFTILDRLSKPIQFGIFEYRILNSIISSKTRG